MQFKAYIFDFISLFFIECLGMRQHDGGHRFRHFFL